MQKIGIRGIQDTRHMVTGKTDQVQNNGKNQSGRKSSSLAIRQLRIGITFCRLSLGPALPDIVLCLELKFQWTQIHLL